MKALVLSGGGALGAFEAGAVNALWEAGERWDIVCGTSIGAINASFVAQDKLVDLDALWRSIGTSQPPLLQFVDTVQKANDFADEVETVARDTFRHTFGSLVSLLRRWGQLGSKRALLEVTGLYKPEAIEAILNAQLDINALKRTLLVTATNLTFGTSDAFYAFAGENATRQQEAFKAARGLDPAFELVRDNFSLAVRASAAIPGAFAPVNMNLGSAGEKVYVDGGVANNTPVSLGLQAGATEALVILLQPEQLTQSAYPTSNLLDIGLSALTVMSQRILELDMKAAASQSGVQVRYVRPKAALPLTVLDFGNQHLIDQAYALGRAAVTDVRAV